MNSQHPLDRDDPNDEGNAFDFSSPQSGQSAGPNSKWLKKSIRALVIVGILVFISSIAVNNFTYGSSQFQIANIINKVLMVLLLLAFVGILLVYQAPNLQKAFSQMNRQGVHVGVVSRTLRPGVHPLGILLIINLVGVVLAWLAAFVMSNMGGTALGMIFAIFMAIVPGMLITMIVWNKGCVRAYAIGALTTYLASALVLFQQVLFIARAGANSGSEFTWLMGIQWTTIALGGLTPAVYVWLLEKFTRKTEAASDVSYSWKPSE